MVVRMAYECFVICLRDQCLNLNGCPLKTLVNWFRLELVIVTCFRLDCLCSTGLWMERMGRDILWRV